MTRHFWVLVHRYAGLYMAVFLVVAGLTGSVLAFRAELDEWLNPQFYRVPVEARPMLDPFVLQDRAEADVPDGRAFGVDLDRPAGKVYTAYFEPRIDAATGKPHALDFAAIILNPYTGAEIERLKPGYWDWPITRKNVMAFVFDVHYSLALGNVGLWLFGVAAVVWTVDCFIGFYLTLPRRRRRLAATVGQRPVPGLSWWARWIRSWRFRLTGTNYSIQFGLHSAAGLWAWPMLFVFAWSSVEFNLNSQVYTPVMSSVFGMTDPFGDLPELPTPVPAPVLTWRDAHTIGRRLMADQARMHAFSVKREQGLYYVSDRGAFLYSVLSDRDPPTTTNGNTTVIFDATSGSLASAFLPTGENAAQTFTTWITVLHMASVWRIPMQIFVFIMGLVVAMLPITGVYLWLRKRRARLLSYRRRTARIADRAVPAP